MASIYNLKSRFQNLLRPLTVFLAKTGVTANAVTLLAMGLSVGLGLLLYFRIDTPGVFFILPIFLFFRMALNAIDGLLAREHGMQTRLGGFLNELGDVISDTALYLPFAFFEGLPFWPILLAVFLASLSELTGLIGLQDNGTRRYDGPMGKSDRALWFGVLAVYLALGFNPGIITTIFIWALNGLLLLTIFNRIRNSIAGGRDE